jgi:hypothetical protein
VVEVVAIHRESLVLAVALHMMESLTGSLDEAVELGRLRGREMLAEKLLERTTWPASCERARLWSECVAALCELAAVVCFLSTARLKEGYRKPLWPSERPHQV